MDEERSSDTAETFGSQSPPKGVSNQNTEEQSAPEGGGPDKRDRINGSGDGNPGGAGEESQATGHPRNAG